MSEPTTGSSDPSTPPAERRFGSGKTVATAGSPQQYRRSQRVLVEEALAWLFLDARGFYAIDAVCPHMGCLLRVMGQFYCPCHRSRFKIDGTPITGPVTTPLRHLEITLDAEGNLVIHRDRAVDVDWRLVIPATTDAG